METLDARQFIVQGKSRICMCWNQRPNKSGRPRSHIQPISAALMLQDLAWLAQKFLVLGKSDKRAKLKHN